MAYKWIPGVGYEWDPGQDVGIGMGGFTPAGAPVAMSRIGAEGQYGIASAAAMGSRFLERPAARQFAQSLEQPLLGSYYLNTPYAPGVGDAAGEYTKSYADYLGGPGTDTTGAKTVGTSRIRGHAGPFSDAEGIENFQNLIKTAAAIAEEEAPDISAIDPTGRWADLLADPAAVAAVGSLAAYDPGFRGPAGRMRSAAINRRMAPWAMKNPMENLGGVATQGDWLRYLASVVPGDYRVGTF